MRERTLDGKEEERERRGGTEGMGREEGDHGSMKTRMNESKWERSRRNCWNATPMCIRTHLQVRALARSERRVDLVARADKEKNELHRK